MNAVKLGAVDYLAKPVDADDVVVVSAEVAGKIVSVAPDVGDRVKTALFIPGAGGQLQRDMRMVPAVPVFPKRFLA